MKQPEFIFEFKHQSRGMFKYKRLTINEKINVKSRLAHDSFFNYLFEFADVNGYLELTEIPYHKTLDYPHYALGTKFLTPTK